MHSSRASTRCSGPRAIDWWARSRTAPARRAPWPVSALPTPSPGAGGSSTSTISRRCPTRAGAGTGAPCLTGWPTRRRAAAATNFTSPRASGPSARTPTACTSTPACASPRTTSPRGWGANLGVMRDEATFRVKAGLAEMLKGGVIMDVVTPEQAKVAEDAGAAAVMALERVPADIRRDGGVARMSDPSMIRGIQEAVTIPVMAKARIGHFAEAQVLEALEIDYIDESEVLTPADEANHIDKWGFKVPFVCGATNLGEALRRIGEGAAMIRSKGEAGTGNIVEAVRHLRSINGDIRRLASSDQAELAGAATVLRARGDLVGAWAERGGLPVVLFCAGGIATPADAALVMQLGAEGVFVGSGIFKSSDPERRARAIVEATTHFEDPERVAAASRELGEPMPGVEIGTLQENGGLLQNRGW